VISEDGADQTLGMRQTTMLVSEGPTAHGGLPQTGLLLAKKQAGTSRTLVFSV
jgi:hypothetical protein